MRKAILVKFIQVLLAALVLNTVIFYIVTSSVLMKNARTDMLYMLETIDYMMDFSGNVEEFSQKLLAVTGKYNGRFTVIERDGTVVADTGVTDTSPMESHEKREEVAAAIAEGSGYAKRYSATLKETMLYVAAQSSHSDYILRLSIPYSGMREYLIMLFPAICLSFFVALVAAVFSADKFSVSISRPLQEISHEMLKQGRERRTFDFEQYPYEELNVIARTTVQMSGNLREYLGQLELEKQIRQEFFSNASHELKTPLTSIQGYAELLENDIIQDEGQRKDFIRRIKKEAGNMTSLINDILMISKLESKDVKVVKSEVRLSPLLEEIIESVKPFAALQEVTIHADCMPICMEANPQQMKELIGNLLSNAVKYNKPGGQVWILITKEQGILEIRVRDNGVGIPADSLGRIFERFYRVDKGRSKKQGGTGLGLSIVKHIVNFYNGTIAVESVLNEGTTFTVQIPLN